MYFANDWRNGIRETGLPADVSISNSSKLLWIMLLLNTRAHLSMNGNSLKFPSQTNFAVSSMEYCGCLFDERNIGLGLSSGGGHRAMIPILSYSSPQCKLSTKWNFSVQKFIVS